MTPPLRDRPLELYVVYRALVLSWAFVPFQVYYLEAQGLSLAHIFDLNVVFTLATVCFEVPTGIFADRYGRRRSMALGGIAMTVGCAIFLAAQGNIFLYSVANALFALSMTLSSGADSAWLFDHVRDSSVYTHYEGKATAAKNAGNIVAVFVGAAIYSAWPGGVFVLTAVLTLLGALIALRLPEKPPTARLETPREDLLRALRTLSRSAPLQVAMAYGALTFVLLRIALFADPAHLEMHMNELPLRWTASHIAIASSMLHALKELASALVALRSAALITRWRARVVAPVLGLFCTVLYALMGYANGIFDVFAMVLLAASFGVFSPLMRAVLNTLIGENSRDRATLLSFESMGRRVLFSLASPLFARGLEASSLHAALAGTAWVSLAAYLFLGASAFVLLRTHRPAPQTTTPPEESEQSLVSMM